MVDITWPHREGKIRISKQTCNVLCINFNEIPNLTLHSSFEGYHKQTRTKHSTRLHEVSMVTCYLPLFRMGAHKNYII